jgi:hypothetical protein
VVVPVVLVGLPLQALPAPVALVVALVGIRAPAARALPVTVSSASMDQAVVVLVAVQMVVMPPPMAEVVLA